MPSPRQRTTLSLRIQHRCCTKILRLIHSHRFCRLWPLQTFLRAWPCRHRLWPYSFARCRYTWRALQQPRLSVSSHLNGSGSSVRLLCTKQIATGESDSPRARLRESALQSGGPSFLREISRSLVLRLTQIFGTGLTSCVLSLLLSSTPHRCVWSMSLSDRVRRTGLWSMPAPWAHSIGTTTSGVAKFGPQNQLALKHSMTMDLGTGLLLWRRSRRAKSSIAALAAVEKPFSCKHA